MFSNLSFARTCVYMALAAGFADQARAQTTWQRFTGSWIPEFGADGDIDNDGVIDAFICIGPQLTVYSGASGAAIRQLTAPPTSGTNVAIRNVVTGEDFDGDGHDDIVFGWPTDSYAGIESGAVWVYSGRTSQPLRVMYGPTPKSYLGSALVLVEDLDGDGVREIAAGAPGYLSGSGRVRVYSGRTGAILLERMSPPSVLNYGSRMSLLHDLDGDGRRELSIRSRFHPNLAPFGEIVSLATNTEVLSISALDVIELESCVDVDGDGVDDLIAATGQSQFTTNNSPFRIHSGANGAVLGSSTLTYHSCCSSGRSYVSPRGDLDGDGLAEEFVFVMQADPYTLESSIRVMRGFQQLIEMRDIDPGANQRFLEYAALTPDLNGDGAQEFMTTTWTQSAGSKVQWQTMLSPAPQTYCTGKLNSAGCVATVQTSGGISLTTGQGVTIHATDAVNQKLGLFLWGTAPASTPFLGGVLCVATPLRRTAPQSTGGSISGSDCTGTLSFNASAAFVDTEHFLLGDELFGQFWHRDPANPDGTNSALSDAARALVCY